MDTATIDSQMDALAANLANLGDEAVRIKADLTSLQTRYAALPSAYNDLLSAVDAMLGADAFEQLTQAKKARLVAEYIPTKNAVDAALVAMP